VRFDDKTSLEADMARKHGKTIIIIATLILVCSRGNALAENIIFPSDSGVVDVTKAPYLAKPDGVTDCTSAIQKAIDDHPNRGAIIYLPNGTYLISDTIRWYGTNPYDGNSQKNTILQGQSEAGTILKLKNTAPGYTDPKNPKSMIWTGQAPAQRFWNALRNLTFDTGSNNPGAIGVRFMASNQGGMRHVTIRSGDGQGVIGLDLGYTDEQGPCLIQNVTVHGFDTGIYSNTWVASITFHNITVRNQKVYGYNNNGQAVSIEGFNSINTVPAIRNSGFMCLINSNLQGGGSNRSAIVNENTLFARNISTGGYGMAIQSSAGNKTNAAGPTVKEYCSHNTYSLFPSPGQSLNLPIEQTPQLEWDKLTDWVSPTHYGARPNDGQDDTAAFQKAIDSGKTTLYLPNGTYTLTGTVRIRANIKRIIGCEAWIEAKEPLYSSPTMAMFRLEDGSSPTVIVERFRIGWQGKYIFMEHASARTLVLSSFTANFDGFSPGTGYKNVYPGANKVFFEDVCAAWVFFTPGQKIWARQFNPETYVGSNIVNDGATFWALGVKLEGNRTVADTRNNGKTEVLGDLFYPPAAVPSDVPMFINTESSLSFSMASVFYASGSPHNIIVKETRGGETRYLYRNQSPSWINAVSMPLYIGYQASDESITLDLVEGWNLISLPIQPRDREITKVFESISGRYEAVYAYDAQSGKYQSERWQI
jgi:hypothetical protein